MSRRVAVLFAEGAATVRELASLANERDLRLASIPGSKFASRGAARVLEVLGPVISGSPGAVEAGLTEFGAEAIVTFADSELVRTADLAHALGLRGLGPSVARTIRSKYHQRHALNASGTSDLDIVRLQPPLLPAEAEKLRYPAVLKPEFGAASRHTVCVDDPISLATAVAEAAGVTSEPFVLESIIPTTESRRQGWLADYVSIETAVLSGEVRTFAVTDKLPLERPFREGGNVAPSGVSGERMRDILALVERIVEYLEIRDGFLHTEVKLSEPPAAIEVNARLGGDTDALYRRIGVGSPMAAAVDVALGLEPEQPGVPTHVGILRSFLPPERATRVVDLPEAQTILRLPGVWRVDRFARPGDTVEWRTGTTGRVLDIWLEASDHDEARCRLDALDALLARTARFADASDIEIAVRR